MKKNVYLKDFDYYIDEYMYNCRSRKLRPKTMMSYEQTLRLFERWCLEEEKIAEPGQVVESTIRHYICSLQERGKYTFYSLENNKITYNPSRRRDYSESVSTTTINNYIRNLKAFYTWYSDATASRNPTEKIRQLRNKRKAREYLDDAEVEKLLKIFDKSYYSEHRDYMIIMLLLDTGMRIGECLKITVQDLDIEERMIFLPAENTKGGTSRYVFFSMKTCKNLQRWLQYKDRYCNSKFLFPKKDGFPIEVSSFESGFTKYLGRAGINKDYSPHALRNNFAKRCLMNGMDIYTLCRILGHSSVTITEQAYLDISDKDLCKRYQLYSPIENMK
ncbi:MAG: phage integrase family protein [Oscillospiraceae bacterium]|nr:phage integrase family protein [Oscillospiraceae bacterium]